MVWRGHSLIEKHVFQALSKIECQKWEAGTSSLVAPVDCCCWHGLGVDGGSRGYLEKGTLDFDGAKFLIEKYAIKTLVLRAFSHLALMSSAGFAVVSRVTVAVSPNSVCQSGGGDIRQKENDK